MFLSVLILQKLLNSVRLGLLRDLAGRTLTQKNNDLSRFTKYSILTADLFYLSEALYRNNLGELLKNIEETFYFT